MGFPHFQNRRSLLVNGPSLTVNRRGLRFFVLSPKSLVASTATECHCVINPLMMETKKEMFEAIVALLPRVEISEP